MLVLDINDIEITVADGEAVVFREPGIAVVDERETVFGTAALGRSRLEPRLTHDQFWQKMNADPVNPPGRGIRNQADLVYNHMLAIKEALGIGADSEIAVSVPSNVTSDQLSLLLGIANEAKLKVTHFIDSAVGAASSIRLPETCVLVDIAWHRAILTQLAVGEEVSRQGISESQTLGLASLLEGWIDVVADNFVRQTRFDPLRIAATEQQVFDQVLAHVTSQSSDSTVVVEHAGQSRSVDIDSTMLATKSSARFEAFGEALGPPTTLIATPRVGRLPGCVEFLESSGHRVLVLDDAAAVAALARNANAVTQGEEVQFIRRVRSEGQIAETTAATAVPRGVPTHLLCGSTAIPLGTGRSAADHPESAGIGYGFRIQRNELSLIHI